MPKSYPFVFIVALGCIAMNLMMVQFSSRQSLRIYFTEMARSLTNQTSEETTTSEAKPDNEQPYFHLKTPFYIYENELNWANATVDGELYKPPEPQAIGAE